jgi:hypothetical protein
MLFLGLSMSRIEMYCNTVLKCLDSVLDWIWKGLGVTAGKWIP